MQPSAEPIGTLPEQETQRAEPAEKATRTPEHRQESELSVVGVVQEQDEPHTAGQAKEDISSYQQAGAHYAKAHVSLTLSAEQAPKEPQAAPQDTHAQSRN